MLVIGGATALTPGGPVEHAVVLIDGPSIVGAGFRDDVSVPAGARWVDASGLLAAPGLIDVQVNGGFGHDFTREPASLWAVGARLVEHGVSAFLPTIISSPPERIERAQAALAAGPPAGYRGAVPIGLHLEGPFLSPQAAGAHDPAQLRAPDPALAAGWSPASGVKLVTLAPELPGALALSERLAAAGVVVAAGHSTASYEQGLDAIDAGVRYATHLLNAMPPLDRRAPGLAAALLEDSRVTIGVIPDGIHLHPAVLRLVARICGPERLSAVTDATAALGLPDGEHILGDGSVTLADGAVRRPDGRLAGSALPADEALRRLASLAALGPLDEVIGTMTLVPGRLLGDATRGQLVAGARADVVLLTPQLEVVATYVGGEEAYSAWR